jgi:hypothetical protein
MAAVSDDDDFGTAGDDLGPDGYRIDTDADEDGSPRPPTRAPGMWAVIPLPVKILLGVLILIACGGIYAVSQSSSESSGGLAGGVIEQLIPAKNAKILQQDQVGIDLQTGYSARLAVNGVDIPDDQVTVVSGLDEFLFQPGPGKAFEQWPAGQNCVVATFWANDVGPGQSRTQPWCFTAF